MIMVMGLALFAMGVEDWVSRRFPFQVNQWVDDPVIVSRVPFAHAAPGQSGTAASGEFLHPEKTVILPGRVQLRSDDLDLLKSEHAAWRHADTFSQERAFRAAGTGMLAVLLCGAIFIYLFATGSRVAKNPMRGLALCGLVSLSLGLSGLLSGVMPNWRHAPYAFPLIAVAMVMVVAYDRRMALAVGGVLAALTMWTLRLPSPTGLVLFAGVAAAALPLRVVRERTDLLLAGLWAGIGMAVASLAVALATRPMGVGGIAMDSVKDAGGVFGMCLATGMIVQGALPLIERAFGITTAMTLKDLNDASHPLLQALAKQAPGTYQHSLRLADLAEAAAEAIGADALICRIGAMYHDVGKVHHPHFFIENQNGGANPHDQLVPASSAAIIMNHVGDGLLLAKDHHLPPPVVHCITSHHGTTLVEYFFRAASRRHDLVGSPMPQEEDYRYKGPKPQTAEAAILMLCDGIEGAARAASEHTAEKFTEIVRHMTRKRLLDNQLDSCPLTANDLRLIEEAAVRSLLAMHHGRVKYPGASAMQAPLVGGA